MSAQPLLNDVLTPDVPAPGSILARTYRVEARLGNGGAGIVLRATELAANREVAIKVMSAAAAADPEQVARFRREAKAASSLTSKHVVRVLDFGDLESGLPYLVMEHLEGRALFDVAKERGPLPVAEAVGYVLQAMHGIAEAHTLGIVHRDIKPANLFVTGDEGSPVVKVLDFGASKLTAESSVDPSDPGGMTVASSLIGSPRYMAPEQIRSALEVDARADVYALGATLYELLSGKPIFFADSLARIFAHVLWDTPEPLSATREDVPAALEEILTRCLAKAPADRYATVEALAAALAPFGVEDAAGSENEPDAALGVTKARREHRKGVVIKATVRMARVRMASEPPKRTVKMAAFALAAHLSSSASSSETPAPAVAASPAAAATARGMQTARMVRFGAPEEAELRSQTLLTRRRMKIAAAVIAFVIACVAVVAFARHRASASRAAAASTSER